MSDSVTPDVTHNIVDLRTIGVLGGMSSASSVEYYRLLDDGINRELGGYNAAEVLIQSVNFRNIERFIRNEQWEDAAAYLAKKASLLEQGGADFVIMATNTMHKVAPQIVDALNIPFVHIIDPTAKTINSANIDTIGLLGTQATMEMSSYRDRFEEQGVEVIVPPPDARKCVDDIIFDELVKDVVNEDSRAEYVQIMNDLVESGAEGIVLGCTEIELLVQSDDFPQIPLFDTTALHIERAIELSLKNDRLESNN